MSIKIKLFLLLAASVAAIVLNTFLPMVMADISTNLSLSIAAISLVLVAVFSFSVYKAIVPPLQLITAEINNITQNKDLSHSLPISGHDEIDKLSAGINAMLDSLKDFISNTVNTTSEIASASEKLSVVTEDTRRGVNRQQSESEQVATAMNEMTATVQEVARNAGDAAEASHVADDAAATGREVVNQAISGIKQLAQEVENTARVLDTLQQESNNIGAVLNVIQGIAEQTNLLALNAAIEAARAGETGRGFAVVADEVRSLAQRSQESTAEIQAIIERLQSGSEAAVKAMNIGLEQAQLSVEQADRAGQSLDTIANAVNAINDMNAMIASAAEEQSAVAEEINRNIVNIVDVAEETAHGANETTETTRQLATVAMKLQGIVGHYQLGSEHKALDLSKAKSAHRAWKARLRSFLDGKEALTTQEAVSHKHCILGKWYYSEGLQNFGHLKSMQDIEPPHAEMHALIKEIIELKQQGDEAAAEEIFKEIGPLSEKIVSLLDQVEHQATSE